MQKTTTLIAGLLALSLMTVPVSMAHHADDASDANAAGTYYVTVEDDGLTLWEETNGHEGLQPNPSPYPAGEDGCIGDDRETPKGCMAPADEELEL